MSTSMEDSSGAAPPAIRVELYANPVGGEDPVRQLMTRRRKVDGPGNGHEYAARVPASRPAGDYAPRLLPDHRAAAVPLETSLILWQR